MVGRNKADLHWPIAFKAMLRERAQYRVQRYRHVIRLKTAPSLTRRSYGALVRRPAEKRSDAIRRDHRFFEPLRRI